MAARELHVLPRFQDHRCVPECWCGPRGKIELGGTIWKHRLANDGPIDIPEEVDPGPRLGGWLVVEVLE